MASHTLKEVINPFESSSNKRWELLQLFGPILGVLFVIGIISLISWHSYNTTRNGALFFSNSLLKSEQRYITQEVGNYLAPATSLSAIVDSMLNHDDNNINSRIFMLLGRSVLKNVPQVDSFYLADDDGHFWLLARHGKNYEETTLTVENGISYYVKHFVDEKGIILYTEKTEPIQYDPRKTKWFMGALKHANLKGVNRIFWTDPYSYISTHQFVITAAVSFQNIYNRHYVFTTNISLNKMTNFVNNLKIGKSGQAIIVDLDSHIIAGHSFPETQADTAHNKQNTAENDPNDIKLDPQKQPVFIRALNLFLIHGDGAGIIKARGQHYATIASAMPVAKRSWVLLLNAPESDFASFAQVIQKQTVYFSIIVVILASILAIALIYQGRRVVFYQKSLNFEKEEIQNEHNSLMRLANIPGLLDGHQDTPLLTEVLVEHTNAKRASIWRLLSDGKRLLCEDLFDYTKNLHASGTELSRNTYTAIFQALSEALPLNIPDASNDPRFQTLHRTFMRSLQTNSLYFYPILDHHKPVGLIIIEDIQIKDAVERTSALVSSIVSLRFQQLAEEYEEIIENSPPENNIRNNGQAKSLSPVKEIGGFLLEPDFEGALPTGLFTNVPIMVIELSANYIETTNYAMKMVEDAQNISTQLQKIASDMGLFSMQISGTRIIFLGACSEKYNPATALRLADAAIYIRETCLQLIAGANTNFVFRIGFHIGSVMSSYWGSMPKTFNIWGEALSVAELLAKTTSDEGQIQVSEKAYQELKNDFMFRPRGSFYFPKLGVTKSYILAGKR